MAPGNDVVCSQSLTEVTTATRRKRLTTSTGTLASPSSLHAPLPTLPFDLVTEILCRLPVKLLLQLKCVCKSWKSLISDPKFAKKHLRMSIMCHHLITATLNTSFDFELLLWDSTMSSIFSDASSTSTVPQLQLMYPEPLLGDSGDGWAVSSCDGILLFDIDLRPPLLWNPSIRKFKILPPLSYPRRREKFLYTIGYDHFIDNYKIVAVSFYNYKSEVDIKQNKSEVSVYTLGTDSWRRIDDFPYGAPTCEPGTFACGTVNWLAYDGLVSAQLVLVSLDLQKDSYRKLPTPDLKKSWWILGVLRDCLCILTNSDELDVWVMKEYGIKESWTKLLSVSFVGGPSSFTCKMPLYAFEDDLVLMDIELPDLKLVVYNFSSGTFKIPKIQNIGFSMVPKFYVESLISPCS